MSAWLLPKLPQIVRVVSVASKFLCVRAFSYYHSLLTLANTLRSVWPIRSTSQATHTHKHRQTQTTTWLHTHSLSLVLFPFSVHLCQFGLLLWKYIPVIELNNYSLLLCYVNCLFINMVLNSSISIDIDKWLLRLLFSCLKCEFI